MEKIFEKVAFLKDNFDPLTEARLAEIVHRLRADWIASMAGHWTDVYTVHKISRGDLEKRISTTLRQGFFQFSQFLAGFEMIVLQLKQLGIVREQTLLGLEKHAVDLGDLASNLVEISQSNHCLAKLFCSCDCCASRRDH